LVSALRHEYVDHPQVNRPTQSASEFVRVNSRDEDWARHLLLDTIRLLFQGIIGGVHF
jgi:hypothetical protein